MFNILVYYLKFFAELWFKIRDCVLYYRRECKEVAMNVWQVILYVVVSVVVLVFAVGAVWLAIFDKKR